jgi:hypothetical protein
MEIALIAITEQPYGRFRAGEGWAHREQSPKIRLPTTTHVGLASGYPKIPPLVDEHYGYSGAMV